MYERQPAERDGNSLGYLFEVFRQGFTVLMKEKNVSQLNETKKWLIEKGHVSETYIFEEKAIFKGMMASPIPGGGVSLSNIEVTITFSEKGGFMKIRNTHKPHSQDNDLIPATPANLSEVFRKFTIVGKAS